MIHTLDPLSFSSFHFTTSPSFIMRTNFLDFLDIFSCTVTLAKSQTVNEAPLEDSKRSGLITEIKTEIMSKMSPVHPALNNPQTDNPCKDDKNTCSHFCLYTEAQTADENPENYAQIAKVLRKHHPKLPFSWQLMCFPYCNSICSAASIPAVK